MKEFKNNGSEGWQRFAKENRSHISATTDVAEGASSRPRYQKVERTHSAGGGQRRSFNPNFTADNRLRTSGNEQRGYGHNNKYNKKGGYSQYGGRRNDERTRGFDDDNRFNRTDYVPSSERHAHRTENIDYNRDFNRVERPYEATERNFNRYNSSERTPYGEKRSFGRGEGRPYGSRPAKPSYNKYKGNSERRSWSETEERKPRGEQRRSYPRFDAPKIEEEIRLNKYVAQSGLCSRREADEYIQSGAVTVNGVVITELGTKIKPTDEVKFNDRTLKSEKLVYIVMNKPKGFVTSIDDPHADKTVMDLVKNACSERIYPVGRLDKNSVGVLLLTNDGELTKRLTHPEYNRRKVYEVTLNKAITEAELIKIAEGITLEDGDIAADEVAMLDNTRKLIGVEIHSGRNRIVRRIFEHFGYSVVKLDRVYFAGLTKKNLKRGQWRFLSEKEVRTLKSGMYD